MNKKDIRYWHRIGMGEAPLNKTQLFSTYSLCHILKFAKLRFLLFTRETLLKLADCSTDEMSRKRQSCDWLFHFWHVLITFG